MSILQRRFKHQDLIQTVMDFLYGDNRAVAIPLMPAADCCKCGACGKHIAAHKPNSCAGCLQMKYCGRTCQKKDWQVHRLQCAFHRSNIWKEKVLAAHPCLCPDVIPRIVAFTAISPVDARRLRRARLGGQQRI